MIGPILGQILLEGINFAMHSLTSMKIIAKAQAEGRDISDSELEELALTRKKAVADWDEAVRKFKEKNTN